MHGTDHLHVAVVWHGLAKYYGARRVWQQLEGELKHGEVLVVSGPNGCGKSTLLRLFCGLEAPSAGSIMYSWQQRQFTPVQMRPLLGFVAPDLMMYRELTALENMHFFATVQGYQATASVLQAQLNQVGLGERSHDRVATFSSGMVLRMKYAIALLGQPRVLLLDEPTAMFDAPGRAFVERMITQQRDHGITIIATNDQRELAWGDLILEATATP